jgi:phosphate transport system protein
MSTRFEQSLQRDIDRIRGKVREMLGLTLRALKDSMTAFLASSRPHAYLVVLRDQRIDELERELDRLCLEFIVRQQPVASHLRFVYATIKINQVLERTGDYCESISRQSLKISHLDLAFVHERFRQIADLAIPALSKAVQAFLDQDVELARETMKSEPAVDRLRTLINTEMVHYEQQGRIPLEALTPLLTIARRLERVSDQAENICEEVIYMCTGEYAKHKGLDVFRVLFVDQDNSCLSQMAEAIGNSLNQDKFMFTSAGVAPQPIQPATLDFLARKGIKTGRETSKSIEQIPNLEYYQLVVSFGPISIEGMGWPAKTVELDWLVQNPSECQGSPEELETAFEDAYQYLDTHIRDLVQAVLGMEIEPARIIDGGPKRNQ